MPELVRSLCGRIDAGPLERAPDDRPESTRPLETRIGALSRKKTRRLALRGRDFRR